MKKNSQSIGALFLCLGLTLAAPFSEASSCAEVRLDAPGGSMAGIPPVDQSSETDLCYAITASQMVDAYANHLKIRTENHLTSVLPIAAAFSSQFRQMINDITGDQANDGFDLGDLDRAYRDVRENGSCSAKDLFSEDYEELKWKVRHLRAGYKKMRSTKSVSELPHALQGMGFSEAALRELGNFDFLTPQESFISFSNKIFQKACAPIRKPMDQIPNLALVQMAPNAGSNERKESLMRAVQKNVVNRGLPITINVCKESFYESSMKRLDSKGQPTDSCKPHAGMVVGLNSSCEVLVRNTYDCVKTSQYSAKCDNFQTWIPIEEIGRNTMGYYEFR